MVRRWPRRTVHDLTVRQQHLMQLRRRHAMHSTLQRESETFHKQNAERKAPEIFRKKRRTRPRTEALAASAARVPAACPMIMNCGSIRRVLIPARKRHSFLSFPYVCPEPVLVKSCILYINGAKSAVFSPMWLAEGAATTRRFVACRQKTPFVISFPNSTSLYFVIWPPSLSW
jgi:hypothetical protein